jgi:hypothetical protein
MANDLINLNAPLHDELFAWARPRGDGHAVVIIDLPIGAAVDRHDAVVQ